MRAAEGVIDPGAEVLHAQGAIGMGDTTLAMDPAGFTKTKLTQGQGAISAKCWDVSS
jgi:hypothetical protein